jgi:hypothetical protein
MSPVGACSGRLISRASLKRDCLDEPVRRRLLASQCNTNGPHQDRVAEQRRLLDLIDP